jgi:hypothetical protein
MRLTAVLLREDDSTLERRVCESEFSAKTYADAMAWLRRESIHLRKVAPGPSPRASRGETELRGVMIDTDENTRHIDPIVSHKIPDTAGRRSP